MAKKMAKKTTVSLNINNCLDCPFHEVRRDPDPDDWFCIDDVKVVCLTGERNVTEGCRPYMTRKESEIPDWCPLIPKKR